MANIEEKKTKAQNRENNTGIYRNHKDGVAYKLFSGKKESLSLYNSIMKTEYADPDELGVVTLNSAIYIGRKNDNAIILHFNMLLTEFQTTFNPNMPLRTLIYVANEYEKFVYSLRQQDFQQGILFGKVLSHLYVLLLLKAFSEPSSGSLFHYKPSLQLQ